MKKVSKILTILLVVAFMVGTISVQAAPQMVQSSVGVRDSSTLVTMFQSEQDIYYILYDDLNRLVYWNKFNKNGNWEARVFLEPKSDGAKRNLKQVIDEDVKQNPDLKKADAIKEGKVWGYGSIMKYDAKAKTVSIVQTCYYGDQGQIVYQKNSDKNLVFSLTDGSDVSKYYATICSEISKYLEGVSNKLNEKK